MPLIKVQVSVEIPKDKKELLLLQLSKIASETLGKPEQYVMAALESGSIVMSGKEGPAAFVDVRSIGGLNSKTNTELAQKICDTLRNILGIVPNRVYLNFTDISGVNWGWKGEVFK